MFEKGANSPIAKTINEQFQQVQTIPTKAKPNLLPEPKSFPFPFITVRNFRTGEDVDIREEILKKKSPTLVLINIQWFSTFDAMTKWRRNFIRENPDVRVVEIVIIVDIVYSGVFKALGWLIRSGLLPGDEMYTYHELGSGYLNSTTSTFQEMGVKSRFVPYAFLVDKKALVRWKADGTPTEEDLQCLYLINISNNNAD